jgi:hypothetical protein
VSDSIDVITDADGNVFIEVTAGDTCFQFISVEAAREFAKYLLQAADCADQERKARSN